MLWVTAARHKTQPKMLTTRSETPLIHESIKIVFTDILKMMIFFIKSHNSTKSADSMGKLDAKWQIYSTAGSKPSLRRLQSAALIWQRSSNDRVLCIGGRPSMSCPGALGQETESCVCHAHSDFLKPSPSPSVSSFQLWCIVRVTRGGNHPRSTLQRRFADALWQLFPPI